MVLKMFYFPLIFALTRFAQNADLWQTESVILLVMKRMSF